MSIHADDGLVRATPAWLATVLIAAVLEAQDPIRSNGVGQVLDQNGRGVAGAEVTFVHRPIPWCADHGEADVLHATADESGRFRVPMLPKRPYSAFATWQADGKAKVSTIGEHLVANAFVTLHEQAADVVARAVPIDGLEAWSSVGPLTFRAVTRLPDLYWIPLTRGADGRIAVPALPESTAILEVATAAGHTLWHAWIYLSPGKDVALHVPPPVAVPLEVVDGEGKPVANAEIRHRSGWLGYRKQQWLDESRSTRECWRPVGRTDSHGRVAVMVPVARDPWDPPPADEREPLQLSLVVSAAGFADQMAGWSSGKPFCGQAEVPAGPKPLRIVLQRPQPLRGRLTLDGQQPAASLDVVLFTDVRCAHTDGTRHWPAPVQTTRTDGQGRFQFATVPPGRGPIRIGVIAPARSSASGPATLMAVPFAVLGAQGSAGREVARDLGEESLGLERMVPLRISDLAGNPAQGVEVALVPATEPCELLAQRITTDSAGRCTVLVPPGEWLLWAMAADGFLLQRFAGASPGAKERELSLQPYRVITGTVTADEKPVNGAWLMETGMKVKGSQLDATIDTVLEYVAAGMNQVLTRCWSDTEGRFRIPSVPMRKTTWLMLVSAGTPGAYRQGRFELPSDPDEPLVPWTVELGK
jgi:hypothetical protein